MNPSDANSALATLRQLKEMLDAGALTPQEFEALKQKLIFGPAALASAAEPPVAEPVLGQPTPALVPAADSPVAPVSYELPPASATPEGTDWPNAVAPVLLETPTDPLIEAPEERRNPLTLVFIVGGALLLLAMVLYLTLGGNTPDEHLTSTSQTAADSAATAPEIGPQAEQLTLPPAVPETIRVAPAVVPPPAAKTAATQFRADSATATPARAPAKAVAPTTPAVPPAPDTAKTGQ